MSGGFRKILKYLHTIATANQVLCLDADKQIVSIPSVGAGKVLTDNGPDAAPTFQDAPGASLSAANTWLAAQRSAISTLTDASTIALDLSLSNIFQVTLAGNRTLGVPTNIVAGQTGIINVYQDASGSRTLTYGAGSGQAYWPYQFQGGAPFVLSTTKFSFDQISYSVNSYSTATVTLTIATPCVVTWTAHGLISGQRIQFATTGALPTGLAINTTYWVTRIDADTFKLSTSLANLQTGTFIATTGSQSGIHTATNASITLNLNPNNQ